VTGGVPYGFDVGIKPGNPGGPFIEAMNVGVQGMGVGTVRTMIGEWLPPASGAPYSLGSSAGNRFNGRRDVWTEREVLGARARAVPPEYAYGNRQVQEIPPGATLQLDLELLSIKKDNVLGKSRDA
jgi:hypothetical protein